MRTVVIYLSKPGALGYPLSQKIFFDAYSRLIEAVQEAGFRAVIARSDSYKGGGVFQPHYQWDDSNREFIADEKAIKADLILNRDSHNTIPKINDCPMLNNWEFDELCRDKVATFEAFPEISGFTKLAHTYDEAQKALLEFHEQKVVLKPRFGEQGEGVYVVDRMEVRDDMYDSWSDILVQEFLDSSAGIPGLVGGMHEINLYMVDGQYAGARVREPAEGQLSLSAETSEGRKLWGIKKSQVPKDLLKTAKKMDDKLSKFSPRLFRADFMRTSSGKYKLLELNSRPGLMHEDREGPEFYREFNGALEQSIINFLSRLK